MTVFLIFVFLFLLTILLTGVAFLFVNVGDYSSVSEILVILLGLVIVGVPTFYLGMNIWERLN